MRWCAIRSGPWRERFNSRLKEGFGAGKRDGSGSCEGQASLDAWPRGPVCRPVAQVGKLSDIHRPREKLTAVVRPESGKIHSFCRRTDEISWLHRFKTQKEPDRPAILINFARGSFGKRYTPRHPLPLPPAGRVLHETSLTRKSRPNRRAGVPPAGEAHRTPGGNTLPLNLEP